MMKICVCQKAAIDQGGCYCKSISRGPEWSSSMSGHNYTFQIDTNGAVRERVYSIACKRCYKHYAGQTTQLVSTRMF